MSDLWSRIRKARVFQVLVVYLGGCWLVLQIADVLADALSLPHWVEPVAVLLLLVGLVIVLATAWLQAHPPAPPETDGRVTPRERVVHRWVLPQLTWKRALFGAIAAFTALGLVTAAFMAARDGSSFSARAAAYEPGTGLAVLPFAVSGEAELDVWREGMVDLLSTNLDGAANLRTIDPRTVLARVRELDAEEGAEQKQLLEAARRADARYALTGSLVALGPQVRLSAELTDLQEGVVVARAREEGPQENVLRIVDALSLELLRDFAARDGRVRGLRRTESLTTSSVDALKAYLEAESHWRAGELEQAIDGYSRAIEADSSFALAYWGLSWAWAWEDFSGGGPSLAALERALEQRDRLPERIALLAHADWLRRHGELEAIDMLERATKRYPDDPEAAYLLAETYFHIGQQAGLPLSRSIGAFLHAIELDPSVAAYYHHVIPMTIGRGDTATARVLLEQYERLPHPTEEEAGAAARRLTGFRTAFEAVHGDGGLPPDDPDFPLAVFFDAVEDYAHAPALRVGEATARAVVQRTDAGRGRLVDLLTLQGELQEALQLLRDHSAEAPGEAVAMALLNASLLGRPLPEWARDYMVHSPSDRLELLGVFARAAYAANRGDAAALRPLLGALTPQGTPSDPAGGADLRTQSFESEAAAAALTAVAAWKGGGSAEATIQPLERFRREATSMWSSPIRRANNTARWWLAEALAETGRLEEAARYYLSNDDFPLADFRLGGVYERMGRTEQAREHYARFLDAWRDADPDLPQPRQAREALQRLTDDR